MSIENVSNENAVTPDRILRIMNAFRSSAALKGALELGLFSALGGDSKSAAALAETIGAPERGVRILCDYLVTLGLLDKADGEYRSSPDCALFLDESSPAYLGSVSRFALSSELIDYYSDIAGAVRKGGTLKGGQGSVEPENPIWVEFARAMVPLMKPSAEFIAELVTKDLTGSEPLRVLDIAAGHGIFGIEIAKRHPRAEVVAVDWPAVLEVAAENAERAGIADRFTRIPGSAFDVDFGDDHDVVLLTNFLHHFDIKACTNLLAKVRGALNERGRAVTLEFVPNEDRITPPQQASFAFVMLATTAAGDAYTFRQLAGMAADAGFATSTMHRMDGAPHSVIVSAV